MRSVITASVVACALLAMSPHSLAQSIYVVDGQDPNQVEQLGYPTQYWVNGITPGRGYTGNWYWQQADSVNPTFPSSSQTGGSNFYFTIPGTFKVFATITYQSNSGGGPTPPPQSATRTVTIQPPALVDITPSVMQSPYSTAPPADATPTGPSSMNNMPGQWVYFRIRSNGKRIGPQYSLIPQENITNVRDAGGNPVNTPDQGTWRPSNPNATSPRNQGADNCYTINQMSDGSQDYAICDFKTINTGVPGFVGFVYTYTQANQVIWRDMSGQYQSASITGNQVWIFNGIGQDANGTGYWNDSYQNQ